MTTALRLAAFLGPYKGRLAIALVAMIVMATTTALYPVLVELLTTLLFQGPSGVQQILDPFSERIREAAALAGYDLDTTVVRAFLEEQVLPLFAAVVLLKAASQGVRFYAMGNIGQRVVLDVRSLLFRSITRQSSAFFGERGSGFLVSRVINDVQQVERAATYAIPVLLGDAMRVLALGTVCLWRYPDLSLASIVVLPLAAVPIVQFGRLLKRYAGQAQESLGGLTHRVSEMLGGIRVVHTYGREDYEVRRFDEQSESYLATMMKSVAVRAAQTPVMELIGVAALLLTTVWARSKIEDGVIRPGEVVAFLLALLLLYEPLKAIGRLNDVIMPGLAAAERVFEIVDRDSDVAERADARALPPMASEVGFESVTFRYASGERDAIRALDLKLPRGKVVALVGPSGSGKSTVASLLPRLYDVGAGQITIDGVDVRDGTLESLRSQIALVAQETYLFNDSIRENIAYGRPGAKLEEIREAARAAHADEFIMALPKGYDTSTGERGVQLSGGQRQRIAIARAFLRDAPILILDEATSALDSESEREVQRALDRLMERRAALVIAHRLSTIRDADEIVVLEDGQVVERGTHATLMGAGGTYARLVEADGRAGRPEG